MIFRDKYELWDWRSTFPKDKKLVVTNGCFDILHLGHVRYLETAKSFGDFLLVGINSDNAVKALKGEGRPVNPQLARAEIVSQLKSVDATYIFDSVNASDFLSFVKPNVYVKGGDYTLETLNKDEMIELKKAHAQIKLIQFVDGYSTTTILNKIKK